MSLTTCAGVSESRSRIRFMPAFTWSPSAARGVVPGEQEQVVAFVESEMEPAGDRGEHVLGRLRTRAALQAAVVVH